MIVESVVGAMAGGLTSILPSIIKLMEKRETLKHEIRLAELKSDYDMAKTQNDLAVIEAEADANEGESLRRHDADIGYSGFMGALRASVRPVITYMFFLTYVALKMVTVYVFINTGALQGESDWLADSLAWEAIYPLIWNEMDAGIFGAIMGFWFGTRATEKMIRA